MLTADTPVAGRVFSEARPALEKVAAARSKAAPARAAAVDALAALAFVAGEEPDDVDDVLALLAALWRDGAILLQTRAGVKRTATFRWWGGRLQRAAVVAGEGPGEVADALALLAALRESSE